MSIEKTAVKNERPAVMTTPKVRPPDEGDIAPSADDTLEAIPADKK
jgi:hypothetical protein